MAAHYCREDSCLKSEMGQALANAGRTEMAANAYLEAAEGADFTTALDLQPRGGTAAGGRPCGPGTGVLRKVLARVGFWFPPGYKIALLSLLFRRFRVSMRGLRFTERPVNEIPPRQLMHLDICWSVAIGLSLVGRVRGADFHTRHLLLASRQASCTASLVLWLWKCLSRPPPGSAESGEASNLETAENSRPGWTISRYRERDADGGHR